MGFFPAAIKAKLGGATVAAQHLVFMDFRETPRRWWGGFGDLDAGGHRWQGIGDLISIDGMEQPIGTVAPKTTFTLAGIDAEIVRLAREASDRVKDRRVTVFVQFFEIFGAGQSWQTLDQPYAIWSGIMDQMTYTAEGPTQRQITLTAESIWTHRRRPAYGLYTDRDQNRRHPGDRGLEQVASLVAKTVRWPVF